MCLSVSCGAGNGVLLVILGLQGLFEKLDHAHDALMVIIRIAVSVESFVILLACSLYLRRCIGGTATSVEWLSTRAGGDYRKGPGTQFTAARTRFTPKVEWCCSLVRESTRDVMCESVPNRRKSSRKFSASSAGSHLEPQTTNGPAHPDFADLMRQVRRLRAIFWLLCPKVHACESARKSCLSSVFAPWSGLWRTNAQKQADCSLKIRSCVLHWSVFAVTF